MHGTTACPTQPSSAGRALRVGRSEIIALLVGDVSQPYHAAFAKGMQRAAQSPAYSPIPSVRVDHADTAYRATAHLRESTLTSRG